VLQIVKNNSSFERLTTLLVSDKYTASIGMMIG